MRVVRLALGAISIALALVALRACPRAPLASRAPSSTAVYDAGGRLLRLTLAPDETYRLWTPLSRVSPLLVEATLLHEDRHFSLHPGVNLISLARAAWTTYGGGERRVGGSTITMQLARRLDGIRSRTPGGKLRQIASALWLELRYSKREILEAYLNLAPYGGNVEGAAAASLIHFGKDASQLALPEALALAVVPQSPARRAPGGGRAGARESEALREARLGLFAKWVARHPEARGDEPLVRAQLLLRDPSALPFLAPHHVEAALGSLASRPAPARLVTTLDLPLQRVVERTLRAFVARNGTLGLRNAAALLVHRADLGVRAAVGSADYGDDTIGGQVDGTRARRSPGSALKPFVYALAIEQGVIHPRTVLADTPAAFGGYEPENFDGRYVGPITATDALNRSRNVPAMHLAARLASPTFHAFLAQAGIGGLRGAEHYGLGIVLGGAEVTMEELVALYAALGNGGALRPVRRLADEPVAEGTRVLSDAASFVVLDMLRRGSRLDLPVDDEGQPRDRAVCWKTGTSNGFRDAWTVGLFGPWVMAVWIGNFSGEPDPAFVGVRAAAPLFFELVDAVRRARPDEPLAIDALARAPAAVSSVDVCAVSGALPTAHCARRARTLFLPGRSPIEPCDVHRAVLVDDVTGHRACTGDAGAAHLEVHEVWPSELARALADAGVARRAPPAPDPRCAERSGGTAGRPPRITSPRRGVGYALRAAGEPVPLSADADGGARELFWFVDDGFVGRSAPGAALAWSAAPGPHQVRVVDDRGRADTRELRVELAP